MKFKYPVDAHCQIAGLEEIQHAIFGDKLGTLIEVGVWDAKTFSNSYHLIKSGWKGLGFEPVKEAFDKAKEAYFGCNFTLLQEAVTDHSGTIKVYTGSALSTTLPEMVDIYNGIDWAKNVGLSHDIYDEVPCNTLNNYIKKNNVQIGFDLLIVDVEGAEWQVLQGFDIAKYKTIMCIIEVHENHPDVATQRNVSEINDYFEAAGYRKIYSNHINNIYLRNDISYGIS